MEKIFNGIIALILSLIVFGGFCLIAFLIVAQNDNPVYFIISGFILLIGFFLALRVFKVFHRLGFIETWSALYRTEEFDNKTDN